MVIFVVLNKIVSGLLTSSENFFMRYNNNYYINMLITKITNSDTAVSTHTHRPID